MSILTRSNALIAAAFLIIAVNALTLSLVAYNRSGAPDCILHLSHRELTVPYNGYYSKENSGMTLSLHWRVETGKPGDAGMGSYYFGGGGSPAWLDKDKLAALGFDVSQPAAKQLPREVLLVLEIAGPAYQHAIELAQEYAAQQETLATANPAAKDLQARAKSARERLTDEKTKNSRLFVIDAGLDHEALRARYAHREHFAIVRGQVRPQWYPGEKSQLIGGYISSLSITGINVPQEFRPFLEPPLLQGKEGGYAVDVAFGKRLEPWISDVSKAPAGE
jgi:hypothetical protein